MRGLMERSSRVYWFSGTGNSLYAAKCLSVELGDLPLTQITETAPTERIGGTDATVGFVFPAYFWNLPRAVKRFVDALEIEPDTYIFTVVTMGGIGHGAIAAMKRALRARGYLLNYGRGVKMPDNYVLMYNPTDPDNCEALLDKNDSTLIKIASDIKTKMQSVKAIPITLNSLYKNTERLDIKYTVSDGCTGCGLCKRICPVGNIALEDNKPKWLHRCEHCVACISWCPIKAIDYGSKTQTRYRYRNPRIEAEELTRKAVD